MCQKPSKDPKNLEDNKEILKENEKNRLKRVFSVF